MSGATAGEEWRSGWTLVLAALIGFSFNSVMIAASGLFIAPLGTEFGWSRAQASMGVSIGAVTTALLSPFFGALIDRWGSRRVALPGLVVCALSIAAFGFATGSITQWVVLWLVYALTSLLVKSTVWAAAVSGVFSTARGLALGVTMSGAAISQIITPLLTNFFIESYGWRIAYMALGLSWGGVAFVASVLFLYDARDRRRRAQPSDPSAGDRIDLPGLTIAEAWRDASLWKIAISTLLIMTVTIAVLVHQFPLMTEAGITRSHAAVLASIAGAAGVVGKLVTGWMLDRWHARWVAGITLSISSLTFVLLFEPVRTPTLIAVAMLINGYAAGTKLQVCSYLTARYAGLRKFGTIFGFMASMIALGSGLGPVLGGLIYDWYGNYTPLLVFGFVVSFVSAGLILSLRDYPEHAAVVERGPEPVPAVG